MQLAEIANKVHVHFLLNDIEKRVEDLPHYQSVFLKKRSVDEKNVEKAPE